MVAKIINATEARVGTNILLEGEPYTVKKIDISSTGKHGHSKCRIEATGIISDKKKVFVIPGHDRFEVPMVNKNKAQVLSIGDKVSVMDLESFETLEIPCSDEIKSELNENSNVEYWDIEGQRIIKRKL
ncbi:MAG: translation initiation factor IF-5A [Nanoarchaeota archaeon]|nr:translation initiation factor IF-5A [Nanoarchaeota archaeon]MBU1028359.1 translation initiation factor IF-5A [Nanoarchaeota archaeon]